MRPPGTTPTRCESRPNLVGIRFFCTIKIGGIELVAMYLDVACFRLNSIDDGAFGAIDTDNNGVNDGFRGENDAKDVVFNLTRNGI